MRDPLGLRLFQPLVRNLYLHATDADGAPDRFAFLTSDVLVVLRKVDGHGESAAFETFHGAAHEKKS